MQNIMDNLFEEFTSRIKSGEEQEGIALEIDAAFREELLLGSEVGDLALLLNEPFRKNLQDLRVELEDGAVPADGQDTLEDDDEVPPTLNQDIPDEETKE